MTMTPPSTSIRKLWQDPKLEVTVLWGPKNRLDAPVEWVSLASDLRPTTAPPQYLQNDLVLIDPAVNHDLLTSIHRAADAGANAVVILDTNLSGTDLREVAQIRNVALASTASSITAAQLARRWNTHLVRASDIRSEETLDLQEQLVRSLLANGGISGALRLALRQLPEFEAVAFTYFGEVVGQHHPSSRLVANAGDLYAAARSMLDGKDCAEEIQPDGSTIVAISVCVGRAPEAFLVFRGPHPVTSRGNRIFRQCQIAVLLELGRQQTFRRARRSTVEPLLRGAEDGSLSLSDVRNQLQNLGFLAVEGYRVLCLTVPSNLSASEICSLAEDVLETSGTPVVGAIDEHVYCLIEESGSDQAQRLLDAFSGRRLTGIQIGVSRVKADAINLRVAMSEAHVAAGQGSNAPGLTRNGIQRIEKLGIHAMLAPLLSSDATSSFVIELLGPLRDRDAIEDSRLLETLIVYFDEGCRPGPSSTLLNIHRHSLANRLDRIEALLGINPRDPAHLLTFSLAVKLWKAMN